MDAAPAAACMGSCRNHSSASCGGYRHPYTAASIMAVCRNRCSLRLDLHAKHPILSGDEGAALYKQAARTSTDPAAQTVLLRQSLAWNPREPQTAAALSRLLPEEQGMDLLQSSMQFSPEMLLCTGNLQSVICKAAIRERPCTGSASA